MIGSNSFQKIQLVLSLFIFVACQTQPPIKPRPTRASSDLRAEYNSGKRALEAGETQRGLQRLRKVIATAPGSELADSAQFLIAQTYEKAGDLPAAEAEYLKLGDLPSASPLIPRAMLRALRLKLQRDDISGAQELLEQSDRVVPPESTEAVGIEEIRLEVLARQGLWVDSVASHLKLASSSKDPERSDFHRRAALDLLDSKLSKSDLETIASRSQFGVARPKAFFKLGSLALQDRQFERAQRAFESVQELSPGSDIAEKAASFVEQIQARSRVQPKTIGAVLPLSGKQAALGQKALKGLQLGLGIFGPNRSGLRLAVIDSEGNPDVARNAVERLIVEDHIIGAVGGLSARTAAAEAAKASEFGLPLVVLTAKSGLTRAGPTVFQNSITSSMQADSLIQHSRNHLNVRRLALLYPNDAYGVEFANSIWESAQKAGVIITDAQTYDPKETDFKVPVRKLIGTYFLDDRIDEYRARLKLINEKTPRRSRNSRRQDIAPEDVLPPIIDFDAIAIPDSVRALGQIAPMLAYHDVEGVQLLGPNLWNNSQLIVRGGRFVEGAVFFDQTFSGDSSKGSLDFQQAFKQTFGEDPGAIEAQAFETGVILRGLLTRLGASSRVELSERLTDLKDVRGPFGQLSMSPRRELTRPLIPLTVQAGQIVPQATK